MVLRAICQCLLGAFKVQANSSAEFPVFQYFDCSVFPAFEKLKGFPCPPEVDVHAGLPGLCEWMLQGMTANTYDHKHSLII